MKPCRVTMRLINTSDWKLFFKVDKAFFDLSCLRKAKKSGSENNNLPLQGHGIWLFSGLQLWFRVSLRFLVLICCSSKRPKAISNVERRSYKKCNQSLVFVSFIHKKITSFFSAFILGFVELPDTRCLWGLFDVFSCSSAGDYWHLSNSWSHINGSCGFGKLETRRLSNFANSCRSEDFLDNHLSTQTSHRKITLKHWLKCRARIPSI